MKNETNEMIEIAYMFHMCVRNNTVSTQQKSTTESMRNGKIAWIVHTKAIKVIERY